MKSDVGSNNELSGLIFANKELAFQNEEFKKEEEKITKVNHLYAFISQINQNIVRVKDEQTLFRNSCCIAIEFGKFKMAWIGVFETGNKINLVEQCGIPPKSVSLFTSASYPENSPQKFVLKTGTYYICNDVEQDPNIESWKPFARLNGIRSFMILPIRKSGIIIGTFNLYATELYFSFKEEISLMVEVASDISFALDIFEQAKQHKAAEELILTNEKRFRVLIEKGMDMISLKNVEGKLLYVSPSITTVLGYTEEELLNTPASHFIHPDDLAALISQTAIILKTAGSSFFHEPRYLHKNGTWVWCEGYVTNMLDESGIHALVSNFRDVTDRKMKERELKASETFSHEILNSLSSHIAVINATGEVVAVNEAWTRFAEENGNTSLEHTGLGSNYFTSTAAASNRGDTIAGEALKGITDVFDGKVASFYYEYPCHSPQKQRWFAMRVKKFKSGGSMVVVAHTDISERKLSEETLIVKNDELQKANAELDRFVYSVSHDLRSPLTSVLGLLHFIETESKETNTLEYAKMIRSSITRLDGFIKNILNYSRNNRTKMDVQEIPLQKTVGEIVDALRNMQGAEEIHFEISINEREPFFSDKHRFSTALENIISNAIKYHRKDLLDKYIKITGHSDEKELQLRIEDNGIGIAKEYHEKIFDMFFRLSSKVAGTGVGLYIVREIMEKLGGSIVVESEESKGTAFIITLKNLNHALISSSSEN